MIRQKRGRKVGALHASIYRYIYTCGRTPEMIRQKRGRKVGALITAALRKEEG